MATFGQKGSNLMGSWDPLSPVETLVDLLSPDEIRGLHRRASSVGRSFATGEINRLRALGLSRMSGATGTPAKVTGARALRRRLDVVLRQVENMSKAKEAMRKMANAATTLKGRSAYGQAQAQFASSRKQDQFNYVRSLASIRTQEYSSRKRALTKGLQAGAMIGMSFIPGIGQVAQGALLGGGVASGIQGAMGSSAGGLPQAQQYQWNQGLGTYSPVYDTPESLAPEAGAFFSPSSAGGGNLKYDPSLFSLGGR